MTRACSASDCFCPPSAVKDVLKKDAVKNEVRAMVLILRIATPHRAMSGGFSELP